jgi:hypothetical protein
MFLLYGTDLNLTTKTLVKYEYKDCPHDRWDLWETRGPRETDSFIAHVIMRVILFQERHAKDHFYRADIFHRPNRGETPHLIIVFNFLKIKLGFQRVALTPNHKFDITKIRKCQSARVGLVESQFRVILIINHDQTSPTVH